jgi:hypothetical protein
MPFLLKSRTGNELTFTDLGLFSLAGYPYSLKLLWSPLVDSYFSSGVGRRKSWIIPTQLLIGATFIWISSRVDEWIAHADADIKYITVAFTLLILFCATQDIAVDGWALTLLEPDQVHYSSTCQTIGLNSGFFISFTVFLALNSTDFCNAYLRKIPMTGGLVELGSFLRFWGFISVVGTVAVAFMKRESMSGTQFIPNDIIGAYSTIHQIAKKENVRLLGAVLLLNRIGYIAFDAIAPLKLIERGFPREKLALTVLIDFPCQIAIGFLAVRWAKGSRPLWAWQRALILKLVMAFVAMLVLAAFPSNGIISSSYFLTVVIMTIMSSFASTMMFVSMSAFFSTVSDPSIGGTYMTFLNTLSNLGGVWPKLLVMAAVDWFTIQSCKSGPCTTILDGFYAVNVLCLIAGSMLAWKYLFPMVHHLEIIQPRYWHINNIPTHLIGIV